MSRLEQLKRLVAAASQDPLAHYGLGLEYLNLQDWSSATASFDAAIRADPKYSAAYYHKARAQIHAAQTAAARETLVRGMEVARGAGDWHTQGEMQSLLDTIE